MATSCSRRSSTGSPGRDSAVTKRDGLAADVMAVGFLMGGIGHFTRPAMYTRIMPRVLPFHRGFVYVSGVLELVCGVGLLLRRPWSAPASVALLLAVWPANLQHAVDAGTGRHEGLWDNKV